MSIPRCIAAPLLRAAGRLISLVLASTALPASLFTSGCGGERAAPPTSPPPPPSPPPAVARLVLTPGDTVLPVGDAVRYVATAYDSSGRVLTGRAITWRAADTGVVAVDSAGRVVANALGRTDVTAEAGGATASVRVAAAPRLVALPLPPGYAYAWVTGITSQNVIVGTAFTRYYPEAHDSPENPFPTHHAFVYTPERGAAILPDWGGVSFGVGVTAAGEAVGWGWHEAQQLDRPLLWTASQQLDPRSGELLYGLVPVGVAASGTVVYFRGLPYRVVTGSGESEVLPAGFRYTAIADDGTILGRVDATGSSQGVAALWRRGAGVERLDGLPPRMVASRVADGTQLAGTFSADPTRDGYPYRAFYWSPPTGLLELPPLGDHNNQPTAINGRGEVVGDAWWAGPSVRGHAFYWTRALGVVDLGGIGGGISQAGAISPTGVVAGHADVYGKGPTMGTPVVWLTRRSQCVPAWCPGAAR